MRSASNLAELRQMAKQPAKEAGGSTVRDFFNANRPAMAAVLPKHVDPDRMLRIALTAIRNTPKLMDCTTESLMGAVMQCALLGLEPNTPLGHAYMIPFVNRRKGVTEVQVIPGYKGLVDLARRSGQIVSLSAQAVYEHDEFDFAYGLNERLHHVPARSDRGEIIAFYAVAKLKDGGHQFEVMWREQVESIRDSSHGYQTALRFNRKDTPWIENFEEMGRKTAIRRLSKYLPLSIEFATAATMSDYTEAGQPQNLDQVLTGEWTALPPASQQDDEDEDEGDGQTSSDTPQWPRPFRDPETGEETWTDSAGEFFDRNRHAMSDSGIPAVRKDGTFRARRGTANGDDDGQQQSSEDSGEEAAQ